MGALHFQIACLTALHVSQPGWMLVVPVKADLHSLPFTHTLCYAQLVVSALMKDDVELF